MIVRPLDVPDDSAQRVQGGLSEDRAFARLALSLNRPLSPHVVDLGSWLPVDLLEQTSLRLGDAPDVSCGLKAALKEYGVLG